MKKYKITVNGQTYEVEVEEIGGQNPGPTQTNPTANTPAAEITQPQPQPKPQPKPNNPGATGKQKITSPMPGTIMSIKTKPGDKIQKVM